MYIVHEKERRVLPQSDNELVKISSFNPARQLHSKRSTTTKSRRTCEWTNSILFTAGFELLSVCMTEDAKTAIHGNTEKSIKKKNPND